MIAIISDIHGNVWALDAVLADIARRGVTEIINLGDSVYGPLEPGLTADRLMAARIPSIQGNQDRVLDARTRAQLSPRHVEWLESQPATCSYSGVFCCHGTPASDSAYLTEAVTGAGAGMRSASEIANALAGVDARVVACGHSHVPRVIALPGNVTVVNPGSVGLPAYSDDTPFPHRMETGSPHARYAVLHGTAADCCVDLIAVPYDHVTASECARRNRRVDWAHALGSGYAAP